MTRASYVNVTAMNIPVDCDEFADVSGLRADQKILPGEIVAVRAYFVGHMPQGYQNIDFRDLVPFAECEDNVYMRAVRIIHHAKLRTISQFTERRAMVPEMRPGKNFVVLEPLRAAPNKWKAFLPVWIDLSQETSHFLR